MSNITQFFNTTGSNGGRTKREHFVGPASVTWTAPPTTTEVEVHCWGGGGSGVNYNGGGGGGGYVRHIYPVVAGNILSITVGGTAGTSSVSCPSQSPTSPISASGGSSSSAGGYYPAGGTGGTGTFSIAVGVSTSYTRSYSGGSGGTGLYNVVTGPMHMIGGGGGASGTPYGNGKAGKPYLTYYPQQGGASGGGMDNIFGTGAPWYFVSELYGGQAGKGGYSTLTSTPLDTSQLSTAGGVFCGGGGGSWALPNGASYNRAGSPGGVCGGGGGYGGTGGVGLVILYYN